MENKTELLKQYLVPGKHVHLVGIGGVSMRPLGLVLQGMGMHVTGSDMNSSVFLFQRSSLPLLRGSLK